MARILDFFKKPAEGEDVRAPRRELARFLARVCSNDYGYQVVRSASDVQGPLGGEFELLIVQVPTEFGPRNVRVCVYGMGVFAGD